jgi:hypothetical protein
MGAIVDAINAMTAAIEGEMLPLMLDVAEGVVTDAKTGHTFTNRTGRLERSIRHGAATGNLRRGYRVDVLGATPYGSFVEDGTSRSAPYPYLWPAWERREAWAEQLVEGTIVTAINALP